MRRGADTEVDERGARRLAAAAFVLCAGVGAVLLIAVGEELDTDSVLPLASESETHIVGATNDPPSAPVLVTLGLLIVATALPLLAPRRAFGVALLVSTSLIGLFVAATILRLGLLFAPVLCLQVGACALWWRTASSEAGSSRRGGTTLE